MGGWPNRGGETVGAPSRVSNRLVSCVPRCGRTAHRVASWPPGRPLRWFVSSPSQKRAPHRRILGRSWTALRPAATCAAGASAARARRAHTQKPHVNPASRPSSHAQTPTSRPNRTAHTGQCDQRAPQQRAQQRFRVVL